jgi:hypothetical protein
MEMMLTSRFGEIRETRSTTSLSPGGRRPGERELATTPLFYRSSASGVRGKQGVCTMSKGIELMSIPRHV